MVEKTVDIEAKTSLQSPFGTREINSRYRKRYKPLIKKDKDNGYWEQRDETSNRNKKKAKSYNPLSSANQPWTQASHSKKSPGKRRGGGYLATRVNATKVVKKDNNKTKDLSHVKCYNYQEIGHYTNKCLNKSKNLWQSWQPPCW